MEKQTPLYAYQKRLGAQTAPFAGYRMPVHFGSIMAEHNAVRTRCGLFDVSHMGRLWLCGKDALANLNALLTNDFTGLQTGGARYSPMCREDGGTADDLIVSRLGEYEYLLVVNASNKDADVEHIRQRLRGDASLRDDTDGTALIALQGPEAARLLSAFCELPQKNYSLVRTRVMGADAIVSRTGYTGEDGFEVLCPSGNAEALFIALHGAGAALCGLGARDTLRLEAGMPLYGHELSAQITPTEAGLSRFVKLEKAAFAGREALLKPPARRLVGLSLLGRGIARQGDAVYAKSGLIGAVTSGTFSPTFRKAVCMALIRAEADTTGGLWVDVRGTRIDCAPSPLPFYRRGADGENMKNERPGTTEKGG